VRVPVVGKGYVNFTITAVGMRVSVQTEPASSFAPAMPIVLPPPRLPLPLPPRLQPVTAVRGGIHRVVAGSGVASVTGDGTRRVITLMAVVTVEITTVIVQTSL